MCFIIKEMPSEKSIRDTKHSSKDRATVQRDGSVVKSTGCSFRGPGLNFQHPYGNCLSNLSETLVPEDLTPPYTEYMQANIIKRKKTKSDLHTELARW